MKPAPSKSFLLTLLLGSSAVGTSSGISTAVSVISTVSELVLSEVSAVAIELFSSSFISSEVFS